MVTSVIYSKAIHAAVKGDLDFDTGTFKCMLVNNTYATRTDENKKDSDDFIDDVSANEVSGTNYSAGGATATVTVNAIDTTNNRVEITLGAASWATSTITAYGAVYYKDTGTPGTSTLIAYIDFGGAVTSTAGTFSLTQSTLRFQN
jgi:hypothetical protein